MKRILNFLWTVCVCLGTVGVARAERGVVEGGPDHLSQMSSLRDVIDNSGNNPVHILYIHGIGAEGAGDSINLQKSICRWLRDCQSKQFVAVRREWADAGVLSPDRPPGYQYLGNDIWTKKEEWIASAPFVDHYIISRSGGKTIMVDEINWWPIVFPIKCRNIMASEASLSGLEAEYLKDCTRETRHDVDNKHFSQFNWLESQSHCKCWPKPPLAAVFNHKLKNEIVDWGFSDAMLGVGPLRDLFTEAIRQLFVKSASFNPDGSSSQNWMQEGKDQQQFVLVTHSLGSYLALSTLGLDQAPEEEKIEVDEVKKQDDAATNFIFEHTSLIYFFANQVPLLELANIKFPPDGSGDGKQVPVVPSMRQHIEQWNNLRNNYLRTKVVAGACAAQPQIIAWNDTSDLLTYSMPKMKDALVANLYVVNSLRVLYLLEWPTSAHDDYVTNKHVLRIMMKPTSRSCSAMPGVTKQN